MIDWITKYFTTMCSPIFGNMRSCDTGDYIATLIMVAPIFIYFIWKSFKDGSGE
jgi:hypothetical protein